MMKKLKRKLTSERGASMILVMALFLFCVMVSSVILAAASSGTSRTQERTTQQQAYLAVSSAVDLIVEELKDVEPYVAQTKTKEYGCKDCNISAGVTDGYWLDSSLIPNYGMGHIIFIEESHAKSEAVQTYELAKEEDVEDVFDKLMVRAANNVYKGATSYTESFVIALADLEETRLPDVICTLTMDENYEAIFTVTTEESDYTVQIEAIAMIKEAQSVDTDEDFFCVHRIYYSFLDKTQDIFVDMYKDDFKVLGNITTQTTTVKWTFSEITKGATKE